MTNSLVASLVQVLVTIVAVFVGYFLASRTERRSWERRKSEQLRDRQLTILTDLVSILDNMLATSDRMKTDLRTLENARKLGPQDPDRQAIIKELRYAGQKLVQQWQVLGGDARRKLTSLRLLGFSAPGVSVLASCVELALHLEDMLQSFYEDSPQADMSEFENLVTQLRIKTNELVEVAGASLNA